MDKISKARRSWNMSRIGSKNTKPEQQVRQILHAMGFRFRLHRKDLPGTPDIVLKKYKSVIFVNGCFWHQHEGCKNACMPKDNAEFWEAKFRQNTARDKVNLTQLCKLGWKVLVVWECEVKDLVMLRKKLSAFLLPDTDTVI